MSTILKVKGLTKSFSGHFAVDDVSFHIEKGNIYGILGPNGSGKSTTLGMILNVVNKTAGSFQWFGGITKTADALKKIGAIIERPNFYPTMSAFQNLKLVCKIKECPYERIEPVLKTVALWERKDERFKNYSLGMKQRLAIASALLNQPEVLILDEPTNGLDPQGIQQIRSIIKKIAQNGTTILLASHLLSEVEKVCSHIIILKKGQKIYEGSVAEMKTSTNQILLGIDPEKIPLLKDALEKHPSINHIIEKNERLIADVKDDINAADLNKYLVKQQLFVNYLELQKPDLETEFLNLTN